MEKPARILLVEDDTNLGFVIRDNLQENGYDVVLCADGEKGLEAYGQFEFDLCVLDIMLPRKDGITLAREIREMDPMIPVLFLTAKSTKEDKINGFRAGGDDYITKPFSIEELICRIEVFLRRSGSTGDSENTSRFTIGKYDFDYENNSLWLNDDKRVLTKREAEILKTLFVNNHRILKREEILNMIWGNDDYFSGRSLDVFISRLRKYLKDDERIEIINYHSVGFKLEIKDQ